MKSREVAKKQVSKKLVHWGLHPKCANERKKMVDLEQKNELSYNEMKKMSWIRCINCKLCNGQKTLDAWV